MAHAQSGSVGGSIGNDQKSMSGTRSAPRAAEPARRAKPEAPAPRRAAKKSGGGGGSNPSADGVWSVASVGTPCGRSTEAIVVTSGKVIGQYTNGQVGPNGTVSGSGSSNGITWTTSGNFSGRSGSGTFRRSDGCVGTWTASKK